MLNPINIKCLVDEDLVLSRRSGAEMNIHTNMEQHGEPLFDIVDQEFLFNDRDRNAHIGNSCRRLMHGRQRSLGCFLAKDLAQIVLSFCESLLRLRPGASISHGGKC